MEKSKAPVLYPDTILLCYNTIIKVVMILERSNLTNAVKEHCYMAVKVFVIIYIDLIYKTNTNVLSEKEFDVFFKLFPTTYFNNRALIPEDMILDNIRICIRTNSIVSNTDCVCKDFSKENQV